MKRVIKLTIIGGFSIAAFAVWVHSVTVSANSAELTSPRSLYVQNCATCHGANGKAQTKRGLQIGATDLTSEDVQSMDRAKIIRAITNGRPGMPGYKKKLTARQIAQIAAYVHAF